MSLLVSSLALAFAAQEAEPSLYDQITAADAALFEAFNSCDGEGFGRFIADGIEFYHDLDGLETDKAPLVEAVNTSICGNFNRLLNEESVEVWPVPGHGAIHTGVHYFIQPGAAEPHGRGRFLHVWQQNEQGWQITRGMSYDNGPYEGTDPTD